MFSAQHKFGRLGAPAGRSLDAAIRSLLPDVWYDPSDTATLFQDSAGTTPVSAVEQPVGLMLDKSRGLVLGPELIASSSPSGSGWAGTNATATGNTVTFSAQFGNRRYGLNTSADKWYRFSFTARRISGNTALHIFHENSATGDYTAFTATGTAATYQVTVRGKTGGGAINFGVQDRNASGFGDLEVYDLSVRELPGNHCFHTPGDTTTRPVTKAGVLLNFDGANDGMVSSTGGGATSGFAFVTAIKLQGGSKTQTVFSDAGTNAGFRVRINSSNQLELSAGNGSTFVSAATTDTLSVGTTAVIAAWHDGANLNVQVNNGTVAQQSLASATAGTAGFTLGRDNGASSSFMQAQTSATLYAKKVLTASQIAVAKRYCAQKAGVAL